MTVSAMRLSASLCTSETLQQARCVRAEGKCERAAGCESYCFLSVFRLSSLPSYYIPHDGPLLSYLGYINGFPPNEHPEVFGQHFNADIASQIAEARMLFDTMLSLQPQATGPAAAGGGLSREDKVHLVTPVFSEVLKFKKQYVTLCE